MLGVYFAVSGAISSVALGIVGNNIGLTFTLWTRVLGLVVTLAFWRFEPVVQGR
jgi:hypothetical protein